MEPGDSLHSAERETEAGRGGGGGGWGPGAQGGLNPAGSLRWREQVNRKVTATLRSGRAEPSRPAVALTWAASSSRDAASRAAAMSAGPTAVLGGRFPGNAFRTPRRACAESACARRPPALGRGGAAPAQNDARRQDGGEHC